VRGVVRCLAVTAASAISLSVVGATVSAGGAARSLEQPRTSQPTELNLTKDPKNRYGEPQIAVNPKNPKNLVYAALAMGLTYACQHAKRPECQAVDTAFAPQPKGLIDNKPGFSHVSVTCRSIVARRGRNPAMYPRSPQVTPRWSSAATRCSPLGLTEPFISGGTTSASATWAARSFDAGGIAVSKSTNGGRSWSKPVLTRTPVDRRFLRRR
jgi:hypothetical protein